MTKIATIADIHWRSLSRHQEFLRAFEILFEQLKEEKPDIIINCGDLYHSKTLSISPEVIQKLAWMFKELARIAPTYTILGNHDGNLSNLERLDLISSIHELINEPNAILLAKSGIYDIADFPISLGVFSIFDRKNWKKVKPKEGQINIALYHGLVSGCFMENDFKVHEGDIDISLFKDFDFAFLGDAHKHQFLATRKDKNGVEKPWIGYPGSFRQNNHGESIEKGYFIWDIKSQDDWDVSWKQIPNLRPFVTVPWKNTVENTLEYLQSNFSKEILQSRGARYRVSSDVLIPQFQASQLVNDLKEHFKASEVTFKSSTVSKMDSISAHGVELTKKSLLQDPEAVIKLYNCYVDAHKDFYLFKKEELEKAASIIQGYISQFNNSQGAETLASRNVLWSVKSLEFNNLFGYGEKNKIDFENLGGIVGILGSNRSGKSSSIGALVYTLFNTTDRGSIKNAYIINDFKDYCSGTARIEVGGTDYIIERRTERIIFKKKIKNQKKDEDKSLTTVNLWKIENRDGKEIKVSANGITRDDTDRIIRKLIGTSEDFFLTALAGQGDLNRFIENKATKRKEFLNRFLELDIFDKLFDFAKADYTALDNQKKNGITSAEEWGRVLRKREREIKKIEGNVNTIVIDINESRSRKDELQFWINTQDQAAGKAARDSLKLYNSSAKETEEDIKKLQETIENNQKKVEKNKEQIEKQTNEIENLNVTKLTEDLEAMEKAQKNYMEFIGDLEFEESILETQNNAIENLRKSPCGDKYPECLFIEGGHKAAQTIDTQKNKIEKLNKNIKTFEKLIETYVKQNIKDKLTKHEDLVPQLSTLENQTLQIVTQNAHDKQKMEYLNTSLKETKQKLDKLNESLGKLDSQEYSNKFTLLNATKDTLEKLEEKRRKLYINLGGKTSALQKLTNEFKESKTLLRDVRLHESIQSAFSKSGIPAMVLKSQLPAINREMAKILDNLVNFSATLETDITSNVMDVYINDGKSKRVIELGSGMEKTACSLALRVALGNLSSLPRPDIFILDESFGALDEDNLQKGMELLSVLVEYFKTVFVITHVTPIKEVADKIIEIKFNGRESVIVL